MHIHIYQTLYNYNTLSLSLYIYIYIYTYIYIYIYNKAPKTLNRGLESGLRRWTERPNIRMYV